MKHKLIFILIAGLFASFAFAGCGSQSGESGTVAGSAATTAEEQNNTASSIVASGAGNIPSENNSAMESQSVTGDDTIAAATTEAVIAGEGGSVTGKAEFPAALTDLIGNKAVIAKKPERIAVISISLLELFHSVGGASICSVEPEDGESEPAFAKELSKVGKASNPDLVGILELEPDLVFAEAELQNETISMLQKSNITVIALKPNGRENREKSLELMKKAAGIQ